METKETIELALKEAQRQADIQSTKLQILALQAHLATLEDVQSDA